MATLETAKRKWARKMANAGPRWKQAVSGKAAEYARGMGQFLGISISTTHPKVQAWQEGVDAVSPEDFQRAVAGKEEKWARRLREAFS